MKARDGPGWVLVDALVRRRVSGLRDAAVYALLAVGLWMRYGASAWPLLVGIQLG